MTGMTAKQLMGATKVRLDKGNRLGLGQVLALLKKEDVRGDSSGTHKKIKRALIEHLHARAMLFAAECICPTYSRLRLLARNSDFAARLASLHHEHHWAACRRMEHALFSLGWKDEAMWYQTAGREAERAMAAAMVNWVSDVIA